MVLDTNLLVSAARSRKGASFAVLQALRQNRFTALASVPLLLEYEAVLERPEDLQPGSPTPAMVDAFPDALSRHAKPIHLRYPWRPQIHDGADEMVLKTALNGRADALLTLNTVDIAKAAKRFRPNLFTSGEFYQRHLLSPAQEN